MSVGRKRRRDLDGEHAQLVMLLGGEPVGRRFIEWNFVASSQARSSRRKRTGGQGG
jgi:redox-sensitive bicupin YhaK (pirin superfamily)